MPRAVEAARIFSGAKTIDSKSLNALGIQVFRAALARAIYRARTFPVREELRGYVASLRHQGLVVIPDFLPPPVFERIREECEQVTSQTPETVHEHGSTRVTHFDLANLSSFDFPALAAWRDSSDAVRILEGAEKREIPPESGLRVFERVVFGDDPSTDTQASLHSDVFYNTHKLWLYLDDVDEPSGPLIYVPGSHRLDRDRARAEYWDSRSDSSGARRVHEHELEERGLSRRVLTCKANTLAVVNTCGYHSRSVGTPGAVRRALHMSVRFNPFLPRSAPSDSAIARRYPTIARLLDEDSIAS